MTSDFRLRPATDSDLQCIVAVHEAAFEGFLLTVLGTRFLRELYKAFIREPEGVCWVAEASNSPRAGVAGFVAGTLKPAQFFRRLLYRRGAIFAFAALPALFQHPTRVLPKLLSAVRYRGESPTGVEGAALLSSLAVSAAASRRGLGRALVDTFCENAARCDVRNVYLTTDQRGDHAVNAFYERAGFRLLSSFARSDGRVMNIYVRTTDRLTDEH